MTNESIINDCSIHILDYLNKEYGLEFPINNGKIEKPTEETTSEAE